MSILAGDFPIRGESEKEESVFTDSSFGEENYRFFS